MPKRTSIAKKITKQHTTRINSPVKLQRNTAATAMSTGIERFYNERGSLLQCRVAGQNSRTKKISTSKKKAKKIACQAQIHTPDQGGGYGGGPNGQGKAGVTVNPITNNSTD